MLQELEFVDMKLTAVLRRWLEAEDWKEEIEVRDDRGASRVVTRYVIAQQPHSLFMEVDERGERFYVYLYSSFNVPVERLAEVSRLLNRINRRTSFGAASCDDDGEPNPVQFRVGIDVEGSELTPKQISNMLLGVGCLAETYAQVIATVALTDTSVEDAWERFLAEQRRGESNVVQMPRPLPC